MWRPVSLPYKNDSVSMTPPTTGDIRACSDILHERPEAKVVAINEQIVVKFGGGVNAWEGQALIYLEQCVPDVPAPRLYAMYHDSEQLFLVMQRAPGVQLDRLWPSLNRGEKDSIAWQLRRTFARLRQAQSPWPHSYGGVDGDGVHHYLFYCQKGGERHLGPFGDEHAFLKGIMDNFSAAMERNRRLGCGTSLYEDDLASSVGSRQSVLTHGDVRMENIMIAERESRFRREGERSFSLVLVDWEAAGWLPDYWEYFCASLAFENGPGESDWWRYARDSLPDWTPETAVMLMFHSDITGCNPSRRPASDSSFWDSDDPDT